MKVHLLPALSLLGCFCGLGLTHAAADLPEPGPENAGLRLRFMVETLRTGTNDTHHVRVDLINVTSRSIQLLGDWPGDIDKGFKEYVEADVSIITEPPIMPWVGQLGVSTRKIPQPEHALAAGETLTVRWTASGRRLKNTSIHPFTTHSPTFPSDGLYAVRASILLRLAGSDTEKQMAAKAATNAILRANRKATAKSGAPDFDISDFLESFADSGPRGGVLLRSNEQLVPVGSSRAMPKHTLGKLLWADTNKLTATMDLGSAHQIEAGDQFKILTGYIGHIWVLKITGVDRLSASGVLVPSSQTTYSVDPKALVPGALAEWLPLGDLRRR